MWASLHGIFIGICINLQFFTSIPIKKQLPLDRFYLTFALQTFPLLGLLQGSFYASIWFVLASYTPFSDIVITLCLWLVLILLSGGIHLDGWIDASDAYFSYQDVQKRLEIMQDPRVGAFGVLSIIVLLGTRFVILYELVVMASDWLYIYVMLVPFLGKMLMAAYLQLLPSARDQGMAVFFQQGISKWFWLVNSTYLFVIGLLAALLKIDLLVPYLVLVIVMIGLGYIFARKIVKNFSGITGDTLGAGSEGMELVLWIAVLLLHSFAMV